MAKWRASTKSPKRQRSFFSLFETEMRVVFKCLSFNFHFPLAHHRLFNSFSAHRSTKITLSPPLSFPLSPTAIIMQSNRLQIDKLSTAISEFFFFFMGYTRKYYYDTVFETCLTTRSPTSLIPCLVYDVRTVYSETTSSEVVHLIRKSIDQFCRPNWLSQN